MISKKRYERCARRTSGSRCTSATTADSSRLGLRLVFVLLLVPLDAADVVGRQLEDGVGQPIGLSLERHLDVIADLVFVGGAQLELDAIPTKQLVEAGLDGGRILRLDHQHE